MNSIGKLAALALKRPNCLTVAKRMASNLPKGSYSYNVPIRVPTMDDLMEPYGSWKVAYAAENRRANFMLIRGIVCFAITCTIFFNSGVMDGLYMPNLDNLMEETEPFNFDTEGRVSV